MKQGLNHIMPVLFSSLNMADVEWIDFLFKQDETELLFHYPSETAVLGEEDDRAYLHWTAEQTYLFDPRKRMAMDTKVKLLNTEINPETEIVKFVMNPTLFEQEVPEDPEEPEVPDEPNEEGDADAEGTD